MDNNVNVYLVRHDVNNYQSLYVDQDKWSGDLLSLATFDGTSRLAKWSPPPVYVLEPKLMRGNFFSLFPGTTVVDEKALAVLDDLLKMSGELLPLPYRNGMLHVHNVTACIDVLDEDRTGWRYEKGRGPVDRYAFYATRFTETPLFKIPQKCKTLLFATEGMDDIEDEFKGRVERHGLTGLIFEKVWSDLSP